MAGLMDKLSNFLMPEEEIAREQKNARERKSYLKIHTPAALKVFVASPVKFEEAPALADYLQASTAILVNFEHTEVDSQRRITDFLNGVSYIIGANVERISNFVFIYVPPHAEVEKELFSYSIPTYIKPMNE